MFCHHVCRLHKVEISVEIFVHARTLLAVEQKFMHAKVPQVDYKWTLHLVKLHHQQHIRVVNRV